MKVGCQEAGMSRTNEVKNEEPDGSCSRKKSTTSLTSFMEVYGLEVEDDFYHGQLSHVCRRTYGVWSIKKLGHCGRFTRFNHGNR